HIEHNTITNSYNAALQVTQDHGAVSGLFFQDNWADGGGCTVNINSKPMGSMGTVTVTDNKFGHDTRVANCPIIATIDIPLITAHNVFVNSTKFAAVRPLGSQVNCGNAFQAAQTSDVIGGSDTRSAIAGQCVNDGQQRLIIAIICFVGGIVLGAVVGSWEGRR
ncbi:MAG: hypothetical protein JWO57_1793, partial [Pseudonocardiales bacterium]|nr:hypothetical protein [Pseudonocardiales bacterium]